MPQAHLHVQQNTNKPPHPHKWRNIRIGIGAVAAVLLLSAAAVANQVEQSLRSITTQGASTVSSAQQPPSIFQQVQHTIDNDTIALRGEGEGRVNVLLLGVGGEGHDGGTLTDTIVLASLFPNEHEIGLISLPRDLAVMADDGSIMKLNAVMTNASNDQDPHAGINELKRVVKNITGQPVHYYIRSDFEGFKKAIDAIDGVTITLDEPIDDPYYPGPQHSYERFVIDAGEHHVDGETALKIARSRYTTTGGDFGRAKRQHDLLRAVQAKVNDAIESFQIVRIHKILDILEEHVRTDMTLEEMATLRTYGEQAAAMPLHSFVVSNQQPWPVVKSQYIRFGSQRAYVVVPTAGDNNYTEIQFVAEHILDVERLRELRSSIQQEHATIAIIGPNTPQLTHLEHTLRQLKRTVTTTQTESAATAQATTIAIRNQSSPATVELLKIFLPDAQIIPHTNQPEDIIISFESP